MSSDRQQLPASLQKWRPRQEMEPSCSSVVCGQVRGQKAPTKMDGRPADRGPDAAPFSHEQLPQNGGGNGLSQQPPRRKYSEVAKMKKAPSPSKKQEDSIAVPQKTPAEQATSIKKIDEQRSQDVEMLIDQQQLSIEQLYASMLEYLQLEAKFQPRLSLPHEPQDGEITCLERDGAAQVMRALKIWYDLPSEVLFHAINLLDRFLTKMKVRTTHLPCITVSCMNLAIGASQLNKRPTVQELVTISQSACSAGDVQRMSLVIEEKLSLAGGERPITSLSWLRLLMPYAGHRCGQTVVESSLVNQLEILVCDAACANIRSPELALLLLCHHLEEKLSKMNKSSEGDIYPLYDFAHDLMTMCRMDETRLSLGRVRCTARLARYELGAGETAARRQRLRWRLSSRTLRTLRPHPPRPRLPTIHDEA